MTLRTLAARAVITAGIASAVYQQLTDAAARRRYPPPGRLIDIGGRHLHLYQEGVGDPPVVIIPALADNVLGWLDITRKAAAAASTAVCVYDRAGVGWSSESRHRTTYDQAADDLHALIKASGITTPAVIAGHSVGGIIARRLQGRHPADVAALLLIDSSHERQRQRLGWRYGRRAYIQRIADRAARPLGAYRLAGQLGIISGYDAAAYNREVGPEFTAAARAIDLSARLRRTVIREIIMFMRGTDAPQPLGNLPVTVLTTPGVPGFTEKWQRMQDDLARLSTCTRTQPTTSTGAHPTSSSSRLQTSSNAAGIEPERHPAACAGIRADRLPAYGTPFRRRHPLPSGRFPCLFWDRAESRAAPGSCGTADGRPDGENPDGDVSGVP